MTFHRLSGITRFFVIVPDEAAKAALPSSPDIVPIVDTRPVASTLDLLQHGSHALLPGHAGWLAVLPLAGYLYPSSAKSAAEILSRLPPLPARSIPAETRGWNGKWVDADVPITQTIVTLATGCQSPPAIIISPQKTALRINDRGGLFAWLSPGAWCPLAPSLYGEAETTGESGLRYSDYPYLRVEAARNARASGHKTPAASLHHARSLITAGRLDFSLRDRTSGSPAAAAAKPDAAVPREFAVTGLRRSGNHAVLQWLLSGLGPDRVFLNNVALGRNPFDGFLGCDPGPYEESDLPLLAVPENRAWFTGRVAYSFEDYTTQDAGAWLHETGPLLTGGSRVSILILRDPYNFFASRIRVEENKSLICTQVDTRHLPFLRDMWIEHADEFTGRTRHLPELVTIDYVKFVGDGAYRAALATRLGIAPDESILARVPDFGAGSSFDGLRHDGKARNMALLERWRHYINHPLFRALMDDPRIAERAKEIYGDLFDHRAITQITP